MLPRTQLLKVSDEDLRLVWPASRRPSSRHRALAQGVALVVVTRGGEGASGWTAAAQVDVPPVQVAVVDTVGAGDTFQAALLTRLAERDALAAASLAALAAQDALAEGARLRGARRRDHLLAPRRRSAATRDQGRHTRRPCRRACSSSWSPSSWWWRWAGWWAGRAGWARTIRPRVLANAAYIFVPALLFRTTARIDLAAMPLGHGDRLLRAGAGAAAAGLCLGRRTHRERGLPTAAPSVRAISATFGNSVQVGIPFSAALFGEAGLAIHVAWSACTR